jgi:hypothetical protein
MPGRAVALINHYGNYSVYFDIEAILFEDGRILLQYGPGEPELGLGTTIGLQTTGGQAVEYYCEYDGSTSDSGDVPFPQEKSYETPLDFVGKISGPTTGNMALLFTPYFAPLGPDMESSAPPAYIITDSRYTGDFSYYMVDIYDDSDDNVNMYGDDTYSGTFPIGFSFPFFSTSYSQFYVSTNGLISFNGGSNIYSNSCLPTNSPDLDMIAAFWDDLYVPGSLVITEDTKVEGDVLSQYQEYTKDKNDDLKILGIECFIMSAAGGSTMFFPLLMAAACAAIGFVGRKWMGR